MTMAPGFELMAFAYESTPITTRPKSDGEFLFKQTLLNISCSYHLPTYSLPPYVPTIYLPTPSSLRIYHLPTYSLPPYVHTIYLPTPSLSTYLPSTYLLPPSLSNIECLTMTK